MGCISSKHGDAGDDRTVVAASPAPVLRKNSHGLSFSSSNKQQSGGVKLDGDDEKLEENGRIINQMRNRELKKSKREKGSGRKSGSFSFKLSVSQRLLEAEHVAAGWPSWLSSAAAEAVHGWVPLQAVSFEKLDKIGQGTYSSVFKAREIETGRMVALKKVRFDNFQPESIRFMAREIMILRRLNHPNIMKLEGVITSRFSSAIYLVFEYMEHDLSGLTSCPDINFSEAQVKCYMKQLLMALEHCHMQGVMHRDIKASNILVNNEGVMKLGDFGLANILTSKNKNQLTSRVVTLWYRPPELLMGSTSYDVSVDLWSVGCVFAEVLMGKPILKGITEVEQLHKIFKLCGSPPDEYWKRLKLPHSTMFKPQHQYESCLRQRCKEIPATALNLLESLLSIEPHKRGSASASLASEYFHTKPYPCDPTSMPKYSPNKEIDAKQRDHLRRKKFGAKLRDPVGVTRKARRPRKTMQESNNDNKTVATEEQQANARSDGKNNEVTANNPNPKDLNQSVDTRSETSQVTTVSRGDIYTGPPQATVSNSFAWAKKQRDVKSTLSYNQPSSISEINDPDSSSFIFRNADNIFSSSKHENQDVSEGVIDNEAQNNLEKADFFDAIDVFPLDDLTTKHKNKLKVRYSGPLIFELDQVDELLQRNEDQIRQAARRTSLGKGDLGIETRHLCPQLNLNLVF
ncbi:putative serine/threonine-protein kinase [Hibiscus syriacus]|uniref:Serine/threonine-protein kinase n=1 Tax=Hibiscus syriacus TaxID=106335 RepID=A0A6A2YIY0_HIBSY|nr:protein IMPAIRED IN BABA-INDUCED STERILITY 1-like [Hibiscus syriacus]KAE8675774.1 putative serine/threonine-protein kinase [Hibiscus syriacus]